MEFCMGAEEKVPTPRSANTPDERKTKSAPIVALKVGTFLVFILVIIFRISGNDLESFKNNFTSYNPFASKTGINVSHLNAKSTTNGLSPCSHDVFRGFYQKQNYFPTGGYWSEAGADYDGNIQEAQFHPASCSLKYANLPSNFLHRCFSAANITSIVTMGDSNGQRNYFAHLNKMKRFGTCEKRRVEKLKLGGYEPDVNYFSRGDFIYDQILDVHYRYCRGCGARDTQCRWKNMRNYTLDHANNTNSDGEIETSPHLYSPRTSTTWLEHLPMTAIISSAIKVLIPFDLYRENRIFPSKYSAESSAEFFLKLYLKNKYPDILIIYLPFNHAKSLGSLRRMGMDIKLFHSLVKLYIPVTTRVFYMPSFREFEHAKSKDWRNKHFNGLLGWQKIDQLNRVLFNVIKGDLLSASSNIYGFFDLVDMSATRGNWSTDGVHMAAPWYNIVTSYFWETFCNSFNLNQT